MFLSPKRILVFITPERLVIYPSLKTKLEFVYPPGVVHFTEVIDEEKYKSQLVEFLSKKKLTKKEAIFLLSENLTFVKEIPSTTANIEEAKKDFIASLPFVEEKLTLVKFPAGQNITFLATNRSLFSVTKQVLSDSLGWQIKSVIPAILLDISPSSDQFGPKDLSLILKDSVVSRQANFLDSDQANSSLFPKSALSKKRRIVTLGLLVILLPLLFFALYKSELLPFLNNAQVELLNDNLTASPSASLISEIASAPASLEPEVASSSAQTTTYKAVEELKVRALNGSGIAGQAAKVKTILESLGFKNIEAGDAEGAGSKETIVIFSKFVAGEARSQVLDNLKTSFASISSQLDTTLSEDILITTGSLLAN